jgi:hypothetical protein
MQSKILFKSKNRNSCNGGVWRKRNIVFYFRRRCIVSPFLYLELRNKAHYIFVFFFVVYAGQSSCLLATRKFHASRTKTRIVKEIRINTQNNFPFSFDKQLIDHTFRILNCFWGTSSSLNSQKYLRSQNFNYDHFFFC